MKVSRAARRPLADEYEPAWMALYRSGELGKRARIADKHLEDCDLCARYCHVNRKQTLDGAVCRTGELAVVNSAGPHHGEEDCLRGWRGSGTIFFSWCNMRCVFCQNPDISWKGQGEEKTAEELAEIMLSLQAMGCHNINLVSPSHVVAQILVALVIAAGRGLRLPLVYNSSGYDSLEALKLLDGVVDIYMPDMKYGDPEFAKKYSHTPDYVRFNQAAVREMHAQVGDLRLNPDGVAERGLLVRHLVLPNGIAGTEQVMQFLAREISPHTYVNIMEQYRPTYRAGEYPELDRVITAEEYQAALDTARKVGLHRIDRRCSDRWVIRWP
ncbi:MAG: radical SAM protein [Proteobacteria bacterium]|nr:radical SAM protein [Pseudomonadota bacterium]